MNKVIYILMVQVLMFLGIDRNELFAQNSKLTDPEIASVAVTANQIDINSAKIARDRSTNADVRKFALTMIKDHQSVIDQADALVKKLKVIPKNNDLSKKLNMDAVKFDKVLETKKGADFDKSYIDHEVTYHREVIDVVENVLIPQTKNSELKDLLQNVLPVFRTHLSDAEMLQKKMK